MHLKDVVFEDFVNYKKPCMFLVSCMCDWKCCREQGLDITACQNSDIASKPTHDYADKEIYKAYINNNISKALVIGGLEPFMQTDEVLSIVDIFRFNGCFDDIVIYSGYNETEISSTIEKLKNYENIIIKFGRFIPGQTPHFDEVLGVNLISDNQYAKRIS